MAGGPLLPSSVYLGAGAGNLSSTFYVSGAASGGGATGNSYVEGIGVVASLGTTQSAVLQFNLPESIPTGVFKCRHLAWANAAAGNAVITLNDGQTAVGSNIAGTTLSAEVQYTKTWTTADVIVEQKTNLTTVPTANDILTLRVDFIGAGAVWTLAATSVHQFSLVWE